MESYDKFNLTLPEPKQKELEELIRQYSTVVTYPAKINRHSPYLSITLPKYYQYYL